MKIINLEEKNHYFKINSECPEMTPNIIDSSLFMLDGEPVGFYLKEISDKSKNLLAISNQEFNSNRVPKSSMVRISDWETKGEFKQYSTIIGSIPRKTAFRRHYRSKSSVHMHKPAMNYIKAMYALSKEAEREIKKHLPEQYFRQREIFNSISDEWKVGNIFTSSISNFNISAKYHRDRVNIKNTVNAIYTKRNISTGGHLHVPKYGLIIDQCDNSLLVYPAWSDAHGVTPIKSSHKKHYRNSFIFYPLADFLHTNPDTIKAVQQ